MKLSDIKKRIVIVCGKICSGKGHYCSNVYPGYDQVTVSDVVKRLANTQVRSELGKTKDLDQEIADALIAEIQKHDKVVVDGVRQISIIKRLQQAFGSQIEDVIWLDVPDDTLRARFSQRQSKKDDITFDDAVASDEKLGIGDVERHIRLNGRVVNHGSENRPE